MANSGCFVIDIESGGGDITRGESPELSFDKSENVSSFSTCNKPMSVDELGHGEKTGIPSGDAKNTSALSPDSGMNIKKDSRKSMGAKKPPKPPRPPRGLSLDEADQKLIKEISELVMIKRARIERKKALKKMKAAKASSASASSSGNLIAMLFTILFCVAIVFQGCHSSANSRRNSSAFSITNSVESNGPTMGDTVVVPSHLSLSSDSVPLTSVEAPDVSASESIDRGSNAIN